MGDFNFHLKDFGKRLKKEGLMQSIPEGVGTHTQGNQLDQIFSNAETREWKLDQLRLTDHNLVQVKLVMKFTNNDLKMTDKEKTVRISDVRKQCWKTFIEEKQDMRPEDLECQQEIALKANWKNKVKQRIGINNHHIGPLEITQRMIIALTKTLNNNGKKRQGIWSIALIGTIQKDFFYLVKRLTKNQKQSQPIKGLTIEQERIQPGEQTLEKVVEFYNKLFADDRIQDQARKKQSDTVMYNEQNGEQFCVETDVDKGITECNFNKAIGQDGFDGKMLAKSENLKRTVVQTIVKWINQGTFPQYIKEGRLVLLSKNQGELYPEVNNTRPIVVNSHLSKIIEKVIVNKIQDQ
ncbi:hypothetical protein OXYTRIMIC_810 [Oxytricha trifallax]|uniref:Endonuclease/exonuclease/phosphatase domain-containing protein n=1 Tax=Oxytricha trifallax TaxID=1172189 RepID=A0A073I083_9SPIT|nr:hypothetical protein OXYTRIMIC_810 [Oxytricha trifallax]